MGILDDAIREHLDLKRRRGADPTEVERAEREALGPVRRAPEAAPDVDHLADEPGPEAGFAYDHEEDEGSWSNASLPDEAAAESNAPQQAPAFASESDDDPFAEPELPDPVSAPAPHPAAPPPHPAGGETMEYDIEQALGSERHGGSTDDEDVLEETPEFLQDTPDHDRLWFEQRPPKDFDFEG
jgi:hypothetical protein